MTFHDVTMLIESVWNKNKKINFHCNRFLEKALYKLPRK